MLPPRWKKVLGDLLAHKVRTVLVVLSIAVGIFAVAVVLGGRAVLIREFERSFAVSDPTNATLTTAPFDDHVLRKVAQWPGVAAADGRQVDTMRYRLIPAAEAAGMSDAQIRTLETQRGRPSGSTVDQRTVDIVGIKDFLGVNVNRFTPEPAVHRCRGGCCSCACYSAVRG